MYNYIVNKLYQSEEDVSENKHYGNSKGEPIILDGWSKVMISAPHCVKHLREDDIKGADIFTYAIGVYINKALGCPFIYQNGYDGTDGNYTESRHSAYKQMLLRYIIKNDIRLLIDIHGMSNKYNKLVDICTGGLERETLCNKTFELDILKYNLEKYLGAENIGDNSIFDCKNPNTISNYISANCNIPCIQLEIALKIREPNNSEELLNSIINSIAQINYMNNKE
ncbi:MAG: hypothetical protein J6A59_11230 [Lachnospiraceae bacterium]|nr:hypothetical protein [Lachnospiraceae bacterium]